MEGIENLQTMLKEYDSVPYPKVEYVYKNSAYANMLYDDMAGDLGELSAVTQYVFEHMNIEEKEEISTILLGIAIQEMKHLNLIGDLIKRLGNTPYYISSKGKNWSSGNVNYKTGTLKETMLYNIKTEEVAIDGYNKAIRYTRNQEIRKLLNRIIMDEKNHIRIFKTIHDSL